MKSRTANTRSLPSFRSRGSEGGISRRLTDYWMNGREESAPLGTLRRGESRGEGRVEGRSEGRSVGRGEGTQNFITGLGVGAALLALAEGVAARRRRIRAKGREVSVEGEGSFPVGERVRSLLTGVQSLLSGEGLDERLEARVYDRLRFVLSRPDAVQVVCSGGEVVLRGHVLQSELPALLRSVWSNRGVEGVRNELTVHGAPEEMPEFYGERRERILASEEEWRPVARVGAGALGAAAIQAGIRQRGLVGAGATVAGSLLIVRALTNRKLQRALRLGQGRRVVQIKSALQIHAPVQEVFELWMHLENLPKFMPQLKEVRDLGKGRSHWVAAAPGGVTMSWDAVTTRVERNRLIAWRSEPNYALQNSGTITFTPDERGGTTVCLQMSYTPPAGAIGDAVIAALGPNPKRLIDEALLRLRALVESGRASAAEQPSAPPRAPEEGVTADIH